MSAFSDALQVSIQTATSACLRITACSAQQRKPLGHDPGPDRHQPPATCRWSLKTWHPSAGSRVERQHRWSGLSRPHWPGGQIIMGRNDGGAEVVDLQWQNRHGPPETNGWWSRYVLHRPWQPQNVLNAHGDGWPAEQWRHVSWRFLSIPTISAAGWVIPSVGAGRPPSLASLSDSLGQPLPGGAPRAPASRLAINHQ